MEQQENVYNATVTDEIVNAAAFDMSDAGSDAAAIVFLIMVGLLLGSVLKAFSDWTKIPYSPMVIILGFIVKVSSSDRYDCLNQVMVAHSYLLKVLLIPALVFGTALRTDWIVFRHQMWYVLVLAVPVLLAIVFITGAFFWGALQYKAIMSYQEALLFATCIAPHGQIVVQRMCDTLNIKERIKSTLVVEGLM